MTYTVLSPWGEAESRRPLGLNPRPETLDGLTVGLYSHFKDKVPDLMHAVEKLLAEKYPTAKFSHYRYLKDATEFINQPEDEKEMRAWLDGVDVVVAGLGDAGSCSMYLCYNLAYIEKLGKPTVTLVEPLYMSSAERGASARSMPKLRIVETPLPLGYASFPGDITDRLLSINMIGTQVIGVILILSALLSELWLVDVALLYTMISFVSLLILASVYIPFRPKRKPFRRSAEEKEDSVLIGALALRHEGLVTRNPDDFRRHFPALRIVVPS